MRYLVAQQWNNIQGNHAGFPHICKLLQRDYPDKYCLIECEPVYNKRHKSFWPLKRITSLIDSYVYYTKFKRSLLKNCKPMFRALKKGDEVFLLEYNLKTTPQYDLALYLRKHYNDVLIIAMTHLAPSFLIKSGFDGNKILKWAEPIDMHITMGSTLSKYLVSSGLPSEKVSTGFHATDIEYYHRHNEINENQDITIIAIGATQRNFPLLSQIVKNSPKVNWILCVGRRELPPEFYEMKNVKVYGFVEENKLRDLMEEANVSINVMDDTIGSNVITNSMSMGLAMIVSDVGSIRDYCNETFAIFCDNTVDSFINAIESLRIDKTKITIMQKNAVKASRTLSIENTNKWFDNVITKIRN